MTSAPQSPAPMSGSPSPVQAMSPQSPAGTSTVPAPPRGPGVVVPFAAPPRDPDKSSRTAVGIIVGVSALVLLCGGSGAAAVGVLVWSSNELTAQSTQTAEKFLDNIIDEKYQRAYKSLCEPAQKQVTPEEFAKDWSELGIVDAETLQTSSREQDLIVVAELTVADGATRNIELTVAPEQQNMDLAVCGWETVQ